MTQQYIYGNKDRILPQRKDKPRELRKQVIREVGSKASEMAQNLRESMMNRSMMPRSRAMTRRRFIRARRIEVEGAH